MTVPSPCISICAIDEVSGYCKGCRRTVEEVAMWLYLSDSQKLDIIAQLPKRSVSEPTRL